MDVVITYVNNNDRIWLSEFKKYNTDSTESLAINTARFRPKDDLKYCLRSIAKNMPFIRKVHLIVSGPSQIPNWINKEEVNIVYHKDIIPEEYLPTFNSRTIEMCMHNIKDLDEEFIYFNDDMFVINECKPEDIFINGKPNSNINTYTETSLKYTWGIAPIYFNCHKRCNTEVKNLLNINDDLYYLTNHGPSPMLKSDNKKLFELLKDKILPTLNRFRTKDDYVHFMYSIYSYLNGNTNTNIHITNRYVNLYNTSLTSLYKIVYERSKFICLNDIKDEETIQNKSNAIEITVKNIFNMLFPNACKYETKPKVSLCVIVKNENKYLKEYINHYTSLGFNNIYLYDNNDIDGENPKDVLVEYINNGIVIYNDFRGKKVCQKEAYNHCYKTYGDECDWIAFFDADELLELNVHDNISNFMTEYNNSNYTCVMINWICYGDNEQLYYEDKSVKERFFQKCPNRSWFNNNIPLNYYIKSIVKTKLQSAGFNSSVHYPDGKSIYACNADEKPCLLANYQTPATGKAHINHYITKSLEEWMEKIKRGYPDHLVNDKLYEQYINRYFIINKETKQKRELFNQLKNK